MCHLFFNHRYLFQIKRFLEYILIDYLCCNHWYLFLYKPKNSQICNSIVIFFWYTLLNISPFKGTFESLIFLFPRWDMLVPWMVYTVANLTSSRHGLPSTCPSNVDPTERHPKTKQKHHDVGSEQFFLMDTPLSLSSPQKRNTQNRRLQAWNPQTSPVTSMDGNSDFRFPPIFH